MSIDPWMQSFGWVHEEVLPQISTSLSWHFRQPFGESSPNVGFHQPTWGATKSGWRSYGSVLTLLHDASESLISEDGRLLDADHHPLASWSCYTSNHWLGDNGVTTYCTHSHRDSIYTMPLSTLIPSINQNTVT